MIIIYICHQLLSIGKRLNSLTVEKDNSEIQAVSKRLLVQKPRDLTILTGENIDHKSTLTYTVRFQ